MTMTMSVVLCQAVRGDSRQRHTGQPWKGAKTGRWLHCVEPRRTWIRCAEGVTTIGQATARPADPGQIRVVPAQVLSRLFFQLKGAWVCLCRARAKAKALASGGGRRHKGNSTSFGWGRRYKGISSAAWFRVLLQHAGAVHPGSTQTRSARTKSPCSDVLRDRGVRRFGGHCLRAAGTGIDEATDIQVAKDAAVRGSGASRPWMACARLLEPGTAQPGDAHDPRTAAAPPEGDIPRCFEAALPRLPPKPRDSGALQAGRIRHLPIGRRTKKKPQPLPVGASIGGGGRSRTAVRRHSISGTTCLAHRWVSSRGSTACEAHPGTSLFWVNRALTGNHSRRSCDDDPTSTSTGTSGFGATP